MLNMADRDIGGAMVLRRVGRGNREPLHAGQRLSRDQLLAIPVANRRALVSTQRIVLYPASSHPSDAAGQRHLRTRGR